MLRQLWNPTGGLPYHRRALEHADRLWLPYQKALAEWLGEWRTECESLLLFGPSGGYTLPAQFLCGFSEIQCFDPDPLARPIFLRRFGRMLRASKTRVVWNHADLLSSPDTLAEALATRPHAAILFSGLLGQLRFVLDPHRGAPRDAGVSDEEDDDDDAGADPEPHDSELWRAWKDSLQRALRDRTWATIHDRLSGSGRVSLAYLASGDRSLPSGASSLPDYTLHVHAADRADLTRELPDTFLRRAFKSAREDKLSHHGAGGFLPDRPRRLLLWQIEPGWHHLMEAVRSQ